MSTTDNIAKEEKCIICYGGQGDKLLHLPCEECNHPNIENQKWVHQACLIQAITYQLEGSESESEGEDELVEKVRCPHCGTLSLTGFKKIEVFKWLKFLRNTFPLILGALVINCLIASLLVIAFYGWWFEYDLVRHARLIVNLAIIETIGFVAITYVSNVALRMSRELEYNHNTYYSPKLLIVGDG